MKTTTNGIEFLAILKKIRALNFQPKNIFQKNETVRFYASKDKMNFSLFNGVMGVTASIDASTDQEGGFSLYTIPTTELPVGVNKDNPEMTFRKEENDETVFCITSLSEMKLRDSNDAQIPMPEFSLESKEYLFQINGLSLKESFKSVEKAIKLDMINDDSSNVLIIGDARESSLKFAGCDSYRININKCFVTGLKNDLQISLSAECFNQLVKILGKKSDLIDVYKVIDIKENTYYCFESDNITIFIKMKNSINILDFEDIYKEELISLSDCHMESILFDVSSLKTTLCKIKEIGGIKANIILKLSVENDHFKIELYTKKTKETAPQYVSYKLPILNAEKLDFEFPTMLVVAPFFIANINHILKSKSKIAQLSLFDNHGLISLSEKDNNTFVSIISYTENLDFFDLSAKIQKESETEPLENFD